MSHCQQKQFHGLSTVVYQNGVLMQCTLAQEHISMTLDIPSEMQFSYLGSNCDRSPSRS